MLSSSGNGRPTLAHYAQWRDQQLTPLPLEEWGPHSGSDRGQESVYVALEQDSKRSGKHDLCRRRAPSPSPFIASSPEPHLVTIFPVLLSMQSCMSCAYAWLRDPTLHRYSSQS